MINARRIVRLLSLLTALAIGTIAIPCFADGFGNSVVTGVKFWQPPGFTYPQLIVNNSTGANFYVQTAIVTGTGCSVPASTMDMIKNWQSIAEAALLSGKSVTFYWYDCAGFQWIYGLSLIQ
jgi:hypothetical protein